MQPKLIYCQDALCGWCYAFGPVIRQIAEEFSTQLSVEVFAGGMVTGEKVRPLAEKAAYILGAIPNVEARSGVKFGSAFKAQLLTTATNWQPNSEPPAVAMAIFKEKMPDRVLDFAADLNSVMHFYGLDLADLSNYRPVIKKYGLDADEFLIKMADDNYVERAHYDFFLCKQLQVSSFPTLFLQTDSLHFYLLGRGYADYETIKTRVQNALSEWVARDN